jgi:aromatic ring-opening dioxygenase catalytic subunit (LigB family)
MNTTPRFPAIYIPHGGGPWPFVEIPFIPTGSMEPLRQYLSSLVSSLQIRPQALLVVSAHWEEPLVTLMTGAHPPMLYDYSGFDPKAYQLQWPAPGAPALAAQARAMLESAGFRTATNASRGFDHGTFVPLMLAVPHADIAVLQVSLMASLDPAQHIAMGRALAPLRDQGVLLIGSGYSYHNMGGFGRPASTEPSRQFDAWLADAVCQPPAQREQLLLDWAQAPAARHCHPREEHLLPLHVMIGAALNDSATLPLRMQALCTYASAVQFG